MTLELLHLVACLKEPPAILNLSFIPVATGKEKQCGGTSFPSSEK
jgi:hypothetical protein